MTFGSVAVMLNDKERPLIKKLLSLRKKHTQKKYRATVCTFDGKNVKVIYYEINESLRYLPARLHVCYHRRRRCLSIAAFQAVDLGSIPGRRKSDFGSLFE